MPLIRSYRDLRVWQAGMDLVAITYELTHHLPPEERYGLAAQVRRAATSVPANVAEGHGRHHLGEYLHHLSFANGSLMELETHLEIVRRLQYVDESQLVAAFAQASKVGKMLNRLIARLRRRQQ